MASPPDSFPPTPLPFLGVLSIGGPDALGFLQGQVSHDVRLLADGRTQLAALCTPQGRVVALMRLRLADDTIHALLPAELLEPVHTLLRRFVLRSKVKLQIEHEMQVGCAGGGAPGFDYAPGRRVAAKPAAGAAPWSSSAAVQAGAGGRPRGAGDDGQARWQALDIADGLPQVFAATSGAFVPQMLNLDLLDAISFSKGCYTGQEIVARTQHLGRIKRRLLGYRLPPGAAPAPLTGLYRDGTKVAEVLMAAARDDGVGLLAVTSLEARGLPLQTVDGRTADPIELPYAVTAGGND